MIDRLIRLYIRFRSLSKLRSLKEEVNLGENISVSKNFRYKLGSSRSKIIIGSNVSLEGYFKTAGNGRICIGNYCSFRAHTFIGALDSVTIGNHVFGAEHIFICDNNNHPTSPKKRLEMTLTAPGSGLWDWTNSLVESRPIKIGNNVWLGRYSMVMKGVVIGDNCIVAAGAVVTKSMPSFSIIAGNPARVVRTLPNDLDLSIVENSA